MLIEVFVDGAARGQGSGAKPSVGEAACAVIVYKNRKKIAEYARPLGMRTNNEAEYEALIAGLLICSMSTEILDPIIYSDSSVVVNQVGGIWECRNKNLIPLLMSVNIIKDAYRFKLEQVPRRLVYEADTLVNTCLDELQAYREKLSKLTKKVDHL